MLFIAIYLQGTGSIGVHERANCQCHPFSIEPGSLFQGLAW